jgi:probable phosphoglycerate mutase
MESVRILALRHGETEWNRDARIQGHLDIGLNARGHRQAELAAQALEGESLEAVYCSDLRRAADTAWPLARARGLEPVALSTLRERAFGPFEGLTFHDIRERFPEEAERWRNRDPHWTPAGGESLTAFRARALAAVEALALQHMGQGIAIVAHGGTMDLLYREATRQALDAPRTWELGNAAINRLLWSPQGFALVGWADAGHLAALDMLDESST